VNGQESIFQNGQGYDVFKSWLVQGAQLKGFYEIPQLLPCIELPQEAIPFSEVRSEENKRQWVHFYTDDHNFECLWNNPRAYLEMLKSFDGVIAPDFSLYRDMPLIMQLWNTYRNRALAHWLQSEGISVIPNVQWGDDRSYHFCFEGIPEKSPVAISTNGCIQDSLDRQYFKAGLRKMIEVLSPSVIINYSYMPDDIFAPYKNAGYQFIHIPNRHDVVRGRV